MDDAKRTLAFASGLHLLNVLGLLIVSALSLPMYLKVQKSVLIFTNDFKAICFGFLGTRPDTGY